MKNPMLASHVTLGAALALMLLASCARDRADPEQQVRAVLAAAESAAEARDVSEAMDLVADGYADARGLDKSQLRNFVRGYFAIHPSISILMRVESLEFPADDLARARVTVGMLGRQGAEENWSLAADVETFDVELIREGEDWRLLRADRE
jgi:hypothetical protein